MAKKENIEITDKWKKEVINDSLRSIPDFPKPGILFYDITTLLLNKTAFKYAIELFVERYKNKNIDVIAALESRGFLFGAPLALELGCALVIIRKPNKLPGEKISLEYDLEYGKDKIEIHKDAIKEGQSVILIDDLIATGGTMAAGIKLIKSLGGEVVEVATVIEIAALKGRDKFGNVSTFALINKD